MIRKRAHLTSQQSSTGRRPYERCSDARQQAAALAHTTGQQYLGGERVHLEPWADWQVELGTVARGAEAFCQRVRAGLTSVSFAQKRQLEPFICVVPTSPRAEHITRRRDTPDR